MFSKMLRAISRGVALQCSFLRSFHISALSRLREITVEQKDDKTTVVDCKYVKSPREGRILKLDNKTKKCPLCQLQLNLKYTDVLILSQYIDSQGNILKYKYTNLCRDQYKLVSELIYMAQHAGLLPEPPSDEPKKPYSLLNTYYDERTINLRPKLKKHHKRFFYLKEKLSPIERLRIKPEVGPYYGPKLD